jgi:hypothetical protein
MSCADRDTINDILTCIGRRISITLAIILLLAALAVAFIYHFVESIDEKLTEHLEHEQACQTISIRL